MDTAFIQKRINEKAEDRLEKEYNDFLRTLYNNPFAGGLKIGVAMEVEGKFASKQIELVSGNEHNAAIFTPGVQNIKDREGINLKEIIDSRREQLIKEETDLLMKQLEGVQHFFEQN